MARLPQPGADAGDWGDILNEFLDVSHNSDGTIRDAALPADASTQRIVVSKDGVPVGTRPQVNFVAGAGTSLTVNDNSGDNRIDVTVTADTSGIVDAEAATLGLLGQTMAYSNASSKFRVNSGVCAFMLTHLPASTITALGTWKVSEGTNATGFCGLALYAASGVLIAQTNTMAVSFANPQNEWISGTLAGGPITLAAGNYYIAVLSNMTTGPEIAASSIIHDAPAIHGVFPSVYLTGRATFPASFTPSTATRNNGVFYLTAH